MNMILLLKFVGSLDVPPRQTEGELNFFYKRACFYYYLETMTTKLTSIKF
jgi:hypothetical protein